MSSPLHIYLAIFALLRCDCSNGCSRWVGIKEGCLSSSLKNPLMICLFIEEGGHSYFISFPLDFCTLFASFLFFHYHCVGIPREKLVVFHQHHIHVLVYVRAVEYSKKLDLQAFKMPYSLSTLLLTIYLHFHINFTFTSNFTSL